MFLILWASSGKGGGREVRELSGNTGGAVGECGVG